MGYDTAKLWGMDTTHSQNAGYWDTHSVETDAMQLDGEAVIQHRASYSTEGYFAFLFYPFFVVGKKLMPYLPALSQRR